MIQQRSRLRQGCFMIQGLVIQDLVTKLYGKWVEVQENPQARHLGASLIQLVDQKAQVMGPWEVDP
jgi:hypothetical protein